jgi:sugar phosphate isomerase/epimerase
VELTGYYFRETTPAYLDAIKARCAEKKLTISGSAVGNDFCLVDPTERRQQGMMVREWIEHTARLGGKTLRIFAGKIPKGNSEEESRDRCILAIQAMCQVAEKAGVKLALENHGGITSTAEQLLAIYDGVDHPALGINLDTGNFHTDDPYAEMEKVVSKAVNVQVKTEVQPKGQPKQDADLKRIVAMLKKANYRGALVLEYEAAADPRTAVPRHLEELRQLLG